MKINFSNKIIKMSQEITKDIEPNPDSNSIELIKKEGEEYYYIVKQYRDNKWKTDRDRGEV